MDQGQNTPNLTPETPATRREVASPSPESTVGTKVEQTPGAPEQSPAGQGPTLPPVQPLAQVPAATAAVKTTTDDDDDDDQVPHIADDLDVIEMEWVNQAKKVIKDTKDDPHAQEAGVEKLQRNYLKKRFGKDIKMPTG